MFKKLKKPTNTSQRSYNNENLLSGRIEDVFNEDWNVIKYDK